MPTHDYDQHCAYCGAPIKWAGGLGCYVHDQPLAELRVTSAEVAAVRVNAEHNKTLGERARRFNALHRPSLTRAAL